MRKSINYMVIKYFVISTILACAMALNIGCSLILSGTSQEVTIASNPPGATCDLLREGRIIGSVASTPGAVLVKKTKHDIQVVCRKPGYQDATEYLDSGTEGATFGNIIAGGLIGWGIDSAAGADNKYPEVKTVTLAPVETTQIGGKSSKVSK